MGNAKMESGVVVITLTATVYMGKIRETHSSRIGFCGEYNKVILSEMSKEFKRYMPNRLNLNIGISLSNQIK